MVIYVLISLYVVVSPLKMSHVFHVMKIESLFHVLLGRPGYTTIDVSLLLGINALR